VPCADFGRYQQPYQTALEYWMLSTDREAGNKADRPSQFRSLIPSSVAERNGHRMVTGGPSGIYINWVRPIAPRAAVAGGRSGSVPGRGGGSESRGSTGSARDAHRHPGRRGGRGAHAGRRSGRTCSC